MSLNKSSLVGLTSQDKTRLQLTSSTITDAATQTVTISQLSSYLMSQTPTADRTITLPSAAVLVESTALYNDLNVADGIPFLLRNLAAPGSGFDITLAPGAGGTADTSAITVVAAGAQVEYLIRIDDVALGSEAYTLFSLSVGSSTGGGGGSGYVSAGLAGITQTTAINHTTYTALQVGTSVLNGPQLGIGLTNSTNVPTFTVAAAGVYEMRFTATVAYHTVELLKFGIGVSGVAPTAIIAVGESPTADVPTTVSASQLFTLAAAATLAVYVESTTADANITTYAYSATITRVL